MMRFVEIAGPNGTLRGSLHLPDGPGPHAGVVLLHGFTGMRMESGFLFVGLSRALEAAGLASLRVDFFGSGESDGDFIDMTVSTERADALAILDFFAALPEIDAERIGLLGLSLGGFVASCTLPARPQVRAAALWSAAALSPRRWKDRVTPEAARSLAERDWMDWAGLRVSRRFLDDLPRHDPYAEIARYGGPVLVVHGTDDATVPLEEAEGYVRALAGRQNAESDHFYVDGGTHVFGNWDHRQAVYERTVRWFARNLK
jgi:dipeptidyl aminopeptidase/acylaminoacyl peptidase